MQTIQFDKRELVAHLWAYFRSQSREDVFFDVIQILTTLEENQQ